MAFNPDKLHEEENLIPPEEEKKEKNKNKKISRRGFLGAMAVGATALTANTLLAGDIPLGEKGVDYLKKEIAELSFEGEKEEAPGIGLHENEALIFQYMLLPRNEEELKQENSFFKFVHGREFRTEVASQLTMLKSDPEAFDKKGWEFYKRYFGGRKMVKIVPKATGEKDLEKEYEFYKEMKFSDEDAQRMVNEKYHEGRSRWSDVENEITMDMSDLRFNVLPPSVTLRHETDHATQKSEFVRFGGSKSTIREIVAIFDGIEMAIIDKEMRREKGLSIEKDENGKELYSKPIKFPSGQEYKICDLLKLTERFYDMKGGGNFPRTFVEILAHPASLSFFENLIYGNPGRSGKIYSQWQAGNKEWKKELADPQKNHEALAKDYLERYIKKAGKDWWTPKNAGMSEDKYRQKMLVEIKKDPEGMHKDFATRLKVENDPNYVFYFMNEFTNRVNEGNLKKRNESDILRKIITSDAKVNTLWKRGKLVIDIDAESERRNIQYMKKRAKMTVEDMEKEREKEREDGKRFLKLLEKGLKNKEL